MQPKRLNQVSVYVENLLEEMDVNWLHQIFGKVGQVTDVFIPKMSVARSNERFGFVRYQTKGEALMAVKEMHNMVIRSSKLKAKLAKYDHWLLLVRSKTKIPILVSKSRFMSN